MNINECPVIIGVDLSMRSTGLCFIKGDIVEFDTVKSKKAEIDNEELLVYNSKEILKFINKMVEKHNTKIDCINLEGLSFNSVSSSSDLVHGNFWFFRTILFVETKIPFQIVAISSWRNGLFTKEERKFIKDNKINIKEATWEKLPSHVQIEIEKHTTSKSKYDMSDSYFIAAWSLRPAKTKQRGKELAC